MGRKGFPEILCVGGCFKVALSLEARPAWSTVSYSSAGSGFLFTTSQKTRRQGSVRAKHPSFGGGVIRAQALGSLLTVHDLVQLPSLSSQKRLILIFTTSRRQMTSN